MQRFGSGGGKIKLLPLNYYIYFSIRFYAVANMANLHKETEPLQFDVEKNIAF